jgi:hypothetical protein
MDCPFVYANGRCCTGHITRARAYGRHDRWGCVDEHDIRKVRLWCSLRWDHVGAVSTFASKERMEFYPDELQKLGLYEAAIALCENLLEPAPSYPATADH